MYIRNLGIWIIVGLLLSLGSGCGKSEPPKAGGSSTAKKIDQNEPVATIRWAGAKRLAVEPSATGFLKIWRLPETEKLKGRTLDKLALAPWLLSGTNRFPTLTNYDALVRGNASASLLRPLLEDLVQEQCYLEIRAPNASAQLALAVHVSPARARTWETNLALVFENLTGQHRVQQAGTNGGWQIEANNSSTVLLHHIQLAQAGGWVVLGLAKDKNSTFSEVLGRLEQNQATSLAPATNDWLQTVCQLRRLSEALSWGWNLPEDWPTISFNLNGDGEKVLTHGKFEFARTLPFEIEKWNIPTNLIHEPLHSFTAVQGLKPWVSSWSWWKNLHAGDSPNQLFCWAQGGTPFMNYAAAPMANAGNTMSKLGPGIMDSLNPLLATNRMGKWERSTNSDGVMWNHVPIIGPFAQSVRIPEGQFLFGGLTALAISNGPPPADTLHDLLTRNNAIYYDRELTGARVDAWMFLSQLLRIIFRREQLSENATMSWLKTASPLLGPTKTLITKTGPNTLSFERTSSFGLASVEFHVLAEWLDSTRFPLELHSQVALLPPLHSGSKRAGQRLPGQ